MKATIILAVAALTIGACSYRTDTVERQTPSGTTVTESAKISTPTLVVRE